MQLGVTTSIGGSISTTTTPTVNSNKDWFDQQTLSLTATSTVKWNSLAERPGTSSYAAARGSRFDEVHVVVVDGDGSITGNSGTILEKNLDYRGKRRRVFIRFSFYWRKFIELSSEYVFGGSSPLVLYPPDLERAPKVVLPLLLMLIGIKMQKESPLRQVEILIMCLKMEQIMVES